MTTLPTPLFIVLCILAVPTVCGILAVFAVAYLMVRFVWEEKHRAKAENERMHQSIQRYLKQNGGKKWPIH